MLLANLAYFAASDEHLYIYSLTITVFSVSNHLCIPRCIYYFARYHSSVYSMVTLHLYIYIDLSTFTGAII